MKSICQKALYILPFFTIVAVLALLPRSLSADNGVVFVQVDPMEKIFRETRSFTSFDGPTEVAMGETADFQIVVRSPQPIRDARIEATPFRSKAGDTLHITRRGFVGYVGVGKLAPERARDAYRPASRMYPDPIVETSAMNIDANTTQPLWIAVDIPEDAQPGTYKATVRLVGRQDARQISLKAEATLMVYPVRIGEPKLYLANWASLNSFLRSYDNGWKTAAHDSEEWLQVIRETAQKMKDGRSNTVYVPLLDFLGIGKDGQRYTFDFARIDRVLRIFQEVGILKMLEGAHIAERAGGWESHFMVKVPRFLPDKMTWQKMSIQTEEARNFYRQAMPALHQHIKTHYPEVEYVQHIGDEPIDQNAESYVKIASFIKQTCPGIRLAETIHTTRVGDLLDIYVPQLELWRKDYDFYRHQQARGKQVWFYTAYLPQADYANRFIELPTLKTRLIHWLNFKYGATGFVHWGFNRWVGNPYRETIQDLGNHVILPGGDSWIVYPSKGTKLYGSVRLEAMRAGTDDYTLLKMLEKKDAALAASLCDEIVHGWDDYSMSLKRFREVRHRILAALAR